MRPELGTSATLVMYQVEVKDEINVPIVLSAFRDKKLMMMM